ncbi:MAG TPA: isochorismatase [Clostridium sp.]|nr:isochorismatase [Clostridium sp.]
MNKALLVMDMQNFCVGENACDMFRYNKSELIKNINSIISKYDYDQVYYIINLLEDNEFNRQAPFKAFEGCYDAELVENLCVVNDKVFKKYESNAFSNEYLTEALKVSQVDEIEIVGVDGGGCVALTAIDAIKRGYKVVLNTKGIGTIFKEKAEIYNQELMKMGAEFI